MTHDKITDERAGTGPEPGRTETAQADAPILEFDAARAVIEPSDWVERLDVPEACVLCFFPQVLDELESSGRARILCHQNSIMGKHPLYELEVGSSRVAAFMPGLGAPLAAGLVDEVIARGCIRFIGCGSAGVLRKDITRNHLVIPASAIRDEGTSYHYAPPSREIAPTDAALQALELVLEQQNVPYLTGKTWTTDAFYRETPDKVKTRREEGCLTVEMEAAALFAVARFRGVEIAMLLYGGDDVSQETWNPRHCDTTATCQEKMFWLSAEAVLAV